MHLAYLWIVSHLSAKNYRNWWKFDEVLTKTNLLSFFWDTVYINIYMQINSEDGAIPSLVMCMKLGHLLVQLFAAFVSCSHITFCFTSLTGVCIFVSQINLI